jgi:hypothetical protein
MEKTPPQKVARWYNDRTLFLYHFSRSNYVTTSWNWFMMFAGKMAEPFLFASVLYSGYELLPGVPQPGAMVDAGVFIAQQVTLDIGGMGLMKIAQQENQGKDSFAYRVGCILIGLMIANVVLSMMKKLIPHFGPVAAVVEGVLLIARAIMAVVYGYAIHSLRKEEREPEAIVKASDIHDRLDQVTEALQAMEVATERRIQQRETTTEQRAQTVSDTFQTFGRTVAERFHHLEANTDRQITEHLHTLVATMSEQLERTEANTEHRLEQIAANTHDQIQAVTEMVRQLGKSSTYTIQEVIDGLQTEMHTHLQERLAPVIERLEDHQQILASLPQHLGQIEEVTQGQLRIVVQEVTLVKTTLEQQTKAFPELAERLIAAPRLSEHTEPNIRKLTRVRPMVSVEEEPNMAPTIRAKSTPNIEANMAPNENDKGAFVRQCLRDNPEIRNADIRRKAEAINLVISPSYISETRKAFFEELSVQNDESTGDPPINAENTTLSA